MRTMKTLTLVACLLCLYVTGFSQQVSKSIPNSTSPDGIIGFLEFKPSDYGTQKHPLIIFLHGIGERGNGTSQLWAVANNGIPNLCANGATMRFTVSGQTSSFVVLSPQLSASYGYWPPFYLQEMIKYAKANLQIDTNRIYVTGLSLGGGGIWGAITDSYNPTLDAHIAAAAPVCGTQQMDDNAFCSTIGTNHLPLWAFVCMDDAVVGPYPTQHGEADALACPISPAGKFTYYQTGGHSGAWVNAYDTGHITRNIVVGGVVSSYTFTTNLYEWFLGQTRAVATNTPPVANAGAAQSITLPVSTVTLTGTGTGTNGATIASYSWAKTSGPAAGAITTSNAAVTTVTGLSTGVYVFTLTVTDNHGLASTSPVTITVIAAPVAEPGPDQTISTTSTTLNAASSYSPNGSITAYNWAQVGGPAAVIVNANTATPLVTNLAMGSSYTFQLTVTDVVGASGSATTGVTVSSALPVAFAYFKGQSTSTGNLLQWGTATEQNNDYFSVERSDDGNQFASLGKVTGAGTSNTAHEYIYTDTKAFTGNYYYRLKQVDKDGKFIYSKVILVNSNSKAGAAQMYPNPVQSSLSVVINNDVKGNGLISVYDLAGRSLQQSTVVKNDKILNTVVDMNNLVPGLYIVELKIGESYKLTKSIMKK